MISNFNNKNVLVLGLGGRGQAACELLGRRGARVVGVDETDTPGLRASAEKLQGLGIQTALGVTAPPGQAFDLAVLSPAVPSNSPLVEAVKARQLPLVGELELGFQLAQCLSIAITGTNGKSTTAELAERLLLHNGRKTLVAGHRARPVCAVVDQTRELDFLLLQVNAFQLESTEHFRPAVAVLLNLAPDHLERFPNPEEYVRATARVFRNQQAFDWAIVQSEALARLKALGLPVPAKTITFSASDPEADLHLERGLLLSRLPNWSGPLLDIDHCQVRGPHQAENLMAALALGHALRQPLERMLEPLKTYRPGPHRFELVAEINGVQYINDSKATNLDALHKALQAARAGQGGQPNVWLIAGGQDSMTRRTGDAERGRSGEAEDVSASLAYHDLGPVLSQRVKRAFLLGETREKIRAAWSLFTPCTLAGSLLEAVAEAARHARPGDVVLLSPACSSFDQFRDYQQRGEVFCQAVKSIGGGVLVDSPNIFGMADAEGSMKLSL